GAARDPHPLRARRGVPRVRPGGGSLHGAGRRGGAPGLLSGPGRDRDGGRRRVHGRLLLVRAGPHPDGAAPRGAALPQRGPADRADRAAGRGVAAAGRALRVGHQERQHAVLGPAGTLVRPVRPGRRVGLPPRRELLRGAGLSGGRRSGGAAGQDQALRAAPPRGARDRRDRAARDPRAGAPRRGPRRGPARACLSPGAWRLFSMTSDGLLPDLLAGRTAALARAISEVENARPGFERLLAGVHPHLGRARRIGLTGPPGAGKSTLIERLVAGYRARGVTVGVVAVDPTSPFSGGALLGDRIRMESVALDQGVFIRSMASRGSLGGLATTTREVCDLL